MGGIVLCVIINGVILMCENFIIAVVSGLLCGISYFIGLLYGMKSRKMEPYSTDEQGGKEDG